MFHSSTSISSHHLSLRKPTSPLILGKLHPKCGSPHHLMETGICLSPRLARERDGSRGTVPVAHLMYSPVDGESLQAR